MFRILNPTSPPSPDHQAMADAFRAINVAIRNCLNFALPESPSMAEVLTKHYLECCVMNAWVYPTIWYCLHEHD
jgi:hypothetical protein